MITPETITLIATTAFSFWAKISAQKNADMMKLIEGRNKSRTNDSKLMDDAGKRSSPFLRKFVGTVVIFVAFGGILIAPIFDVPVTVIENVPQHSIFWGFIKFGHGIKIIEASGIVYPPWVRESVMAICGFIFGPGFAKTVR